MFLTVVMSLRGATRDTAADETMGKDEDVEEEWRPTDFEEAGGAGAALGIQDTT